MMKKKMLVYDNLIQDLSKLFQLMSVLRTGGNFDGFNRKI